MNIFRRKPWVNPFRKLAIFGLFELLVVIAQKGDFMFQNIIKDIFLAYVAYKKSSKNRHFWTQTMGYPLWKNGHFRHFELLVFIAQKGVFSFWNIVKDIFCPIMLKKKKLGKMAIFGPKTWVNPFEKNANFTTF